MNKNRHLAVLRSILARTTDIEECKSLNIAMLILDAYEEQSLGENNVTVRQDTVEPSSGGDGAWL